MCDVTTALRLSGAWWGSTRATAIPGGVEPPSPCAVSYLPCASVSSYVKWAQQERFTSGNCFKGLINSYCQVPRTVCSTKGFLNVSDSYHHCNLLFFPLESWVPQEPHRGFILCCLAWSRCLMKLVGKEDRTVEGRGYWQELSAAQGLTLSIKSRFLHEDLGSFTRFYKRVPLHK